jgi:hypothetical protein
MKVVAQRDQHLVQYFVEIKSGKDGVAGVVKQRDLLDVFGNRKSPRAQFSLTFGRVPTTKSQKKLDDSVNDKTEPEVNDQSQIETVWAVSGTRGQIRRDHKQVQHIADHHGNQRLPKVRLQHLFKMRLNGEIAKVETAKRDRGSAQTFADQNQSSCLTTSNPRLSAKIRCCLLPLVLPFFPFPFCRLRCS